MTQHVIRHNDLLCDFYVPDGDNYNDGDYCLKN
jgi:hypothetical protein